MLHTMQTRPASPDGSVTDVLALESVSVRFGGVTALSEVTLGIPARPGIDAIIGPNGAGKTTLFNVLSGVVAPTSGRVIASGADVTGMRQDRIFRRGISRTFQGVRLFEHLTVEQNVMLAARSAVSREARARGIATAPWIDHGDARQRCDRALRDVGLDASVWRQLPGGLPLWQRRMTEIARAISSEPDALLLDEPAAGLNTVEKDAMCDLLRRLSVRLNCKIVVVEHDMKLVMSIAAYIWVINFGRLLASGTPSEVQSNAAVIDAYLGTGHR